MAAGAALSGTALQRLSGGASPALAGSVLREPLRIPSRGGRLTYTLRADEQETFVAGALRKTIVYNGSFPAPTLVVDPGDRIRVTLVNGLEHPTNLHTHGFHVSPEGNSDNVLLHIEAGETFEYQFDLPRDHAPGLNWYHPHPHGHGTHQMFGGMAGAVIFRSRAERRRRLPPMRDRVLVLQAPEWDEAGELKPWSALLLATQLRLVNGQLRPGIPIREGETQRWRILNATVSDFFDLQLSGHRLLQIAADGNPFERALELDTVHIPPGGRQRCSSRAARPAATHCGRCPSITAQASSHPNSCWPRSNPHPAGGPRGCGCVACSSRSATSVGCRWPTAANSHSRCGAASHRRQALRSAPRRPFRRA